MENGSDGIDRLFQSFSEEISKRIQIHLQEFLRNNTEKIDNKFITLEEKIKEYLNNFKDELNQHTNLNNIGNEDYEEDVNDDDDELNINQNNQVNNELLSDNEKMNSVNINDVEITEESINNCPASPNGVALQVRRGSEPVLNRLSPILNSPIDLSKRWSTAVALDTHRTRKESNDSLQVESINDNSEEENKSPVFIKTDSLSPKSMKEEGYASEEKSENTPSSATSSCTFSRFTRGSGRLSMLNKDIDIWVEAADRQFVRMKNEANVKCINLKNEKNSDTKLSDNQLNKNKINKSTRLTNEEIEKKLSNFKDRLMIVKMKNEAGPLGIHVVPNSDENGEENSLVIQGVEKNGRIDRDGRIGVGDIIVEINGRSLLDVKFQDAQEIFKQALSTQEIVLKLIKNQCKHIESLKPENEKSLNANYHTNHIHTQQLQEQQSANYINQQEQRNELQLKQQQNVKKPPPPLLPKPNVKLKDLENEVKTYVDEGKGEDANDDDNLEEEKSVNDTNNVDDKKCSITNKTPLLSLSSTNTRKIGRRYHIRLTKGEDGLGFSITTRDNPAGGNCPIYIKNILSKGAAILDGRLKPGDRLLEVNGIEIVNKSHTETLNLLRSFPMGCAADLIVSRQDTISASPSPKLPRQLPHEHSDSQLGREREVLTFEIPLNDTGSAGLGVSMKGKTSTTPHGNCVDLGIFVKSVIHGGAASKDGRLQSNDQLISINGIPLLGLSNSDAMETLRRAMIQNEGPQLNPNAITLCIARRVTNKSLISSSANSSFKESSRKQKDNCQHYRNDSALSTDSFSGEPQLLISNNNVPNSQSELLNDTENSYVSPDTTVIYNSTNVATSTPRSNLENNLSYKHPIVDRLIGNQSEAPSFNSTTTSSMFHTPLGNVTASIVNNNNTIISTPKSTITYEKVNKEQYETTPKAIEAMRDSNGNFTTQISIESVTEDISFSRDGFGRQSISEKRHAQLDVKNTDTYKRNKKAKEEKERQLMKMKERQQQNEYPDDTIRTASDETNDKTFDTTRTTISHELHDEGSCNSSPGSCPYHIVTQLPQSRLHAAATAAMLSKECDVGPALGLKKSSSLESLQTKMQELQKKQLEDKGGNPFATRPATLKVSRNRSTNESFRAAVDKSYDAPTNETSEKMETLAEEGSESGNSSVNHGQVSGGISIVSGPNAMISSFTTAATTTTTTSSQMTTDKDDANLVKKKENKKKSLLRSFFKFGSSKKSKDSSQSPTRNKDKKSTQEDREKQMARDAAQLEQARIQQHYKRLIEQQKQLQQQQQQQQSQMMNKPQAYSSISQFVSDTNIVPTQPLHSTPTGVNGGQLMNDTNILKQSDFNQNFPRQQQQYSSSNRIERDKCSDNNWVRDKNEVIHIRTNSYDICKDAMERPGSRMAIADVNNKYSHYMNIREIQQHYETRQHPDAAHPITYIQKAKLAEPSTNQQQMLSKSLPKSSFSPTYLTTNDFQREKQRSSGPRQIRRNVNENIKVERPLSSYEFTELSYEQLQKKHQQIQQEKINLHYHQKQQMQQQHQRHHQQQQQQQQHHHQQQYYGIVRNGNCDSFPRRQPSNPKLQQQLSKHPNTITVPNNAIYESGNVNIYESNYNRLPYRTTLQGGVYQTSSMRLTQQQQQQQHQHHPTVSSSARYQREMLKQMKPGSNV